MNPILEMIKKMEGKSLDNTPSFFANWLNGKLLSAEEGCISVEYQIRAEMVNPMQIAHGGVLAAMMDEVIGMTVYALNNKNFYASVNLNIEFLSSAPIDSYVIVTSELIKKGVKISFLHCTTKNRSGKLLAFSSST